MKQRTRPNPGIQAMRLDKALITLRNRANREDQEGAVRGGQAQRVQCDDEGTLERGTRGLSPIRDH